MSRVSDSLYGATIADLVVTFTTDDPGATANGTILVADGDATVTGAVVDEVATEVAAKINEILDALRAAGVIKS